MSSLSVRLKFEPLRSAAFGAIAAGYSAVGSALANPIHQFKIDNLTDAILIFSFDGINDHFVLPPNGFFLSDITSNKAVSQAFFIAEGSILYVKRSGIPTSGAVYFSAMYGVV